MPNVGPLELVVVLAIVLLIFGPKRLPAAGRALGRSMREFKDSIAGRDDGQDGLEGPSLTGAAEQPTPQKPDGASAAHDEASPDSKA